MNDITSEEQLKQLQERYPFNEEELEILARAHEHLEVPRDPPESYLLTLAKASPYTFYFLPGDELAKRVEWIEDFVLPQGFASALRATISSSPFVNYANQGVNRSLETFLEGIACCGRRGPREAARSLYNIAGYEPTPKELVELAIRLAVAAEVLSTPTLDKPFETKRIHQVESLVGPLVDFLRGELGGIDTITEKEFIAFVDKDLPMFTAPLATFMHRVIFHAEAMPATVIPYNPVVLDEDSSVFASVNSAFLTTLSFMSPLLSGKWQRLYSSDLDGRSFNRLEWSLLGYTGPTLLVIRTAGKAILGAMSHSPWKEGRKFYGNAESFLFELSPNVRVHRSIGLETNFMYLHSDVQEGILGPTIDDLPHGLGFGGSLARPRLFIPSTFEHCSAGFLDKTFETGELLPPEEMEKFEISALEVWAVGGTKLINEGFKDRSEYRDRMEVALERARIVRDKSQLVKDLKSGLIPNSLFSHQDNVRGRQEFKVDDKHGGYTVEH